MRDRHREEELNSLKPFCRSTFFLIAARIHFCPVCPKARMLARPDAGGVLELVLRICKRDGIRGSPPGPVLQGIWPRFSITLNSPLDHQCG